MTTGLNGTGGIIYFGNLTAETRPIVIRRPNPRKLSEEDPDEIPVTLAVYVNGKRCPVEVISAYNAARRAWLDAITVRDDAGNPQLDQDGRILYGDTAEMWGVFLSQALANVVDGLLPGEASVMANDEPAARGLLEATNWLRRRDEIETEAVDRPEAEGGEPSSTGEVSPPDSSTTTPEPTSVRP